jgi:hypothetical protein
MAAGRVHVGRIVLVGVLVAAVTELGRILVESLDFGSAGTAVAALLVGGLVPLFDLLKEPGPQRGARQGSRQGPSRPPSNVGRSVAVALVVLVLLGAGTYGASWLFRYVTATQQGVERMAQPAASTTTGALTATVRGVEVSRDFVKIKLAVTNTSAQPITIAVNDQWCRLIGGDGLSVPPYGGFTGLGGGNIEVPAHGVPISEVLTFKTRPVVLTYTLAFSHLFTMGPGPDSLQIRGIVLTPA